MGGIDENFNSKLKMRGLLRSIARRAVKKPEGMPSKSTQSKSQKPNEPDPRDKPNQELGKTLKHEDDVRNLF